MSEVIKKQICAFLDTLPITTGGVVGVAVSGGADSLALVLNLAEVAAIYRLTIRAVTVDHGLRAESADEAAAVHTLLMRQGIDHTTLCWTGVKPTTRIEEKAREKRYELMCRWCKENQISILLLAHHLGDQAETFWARLAHSTGPDGLGAIPALGQRDGVLLGRPLLRVDKAALIADLNARQIPWAEDTMNQDESFERVQWRKRQTQLSEYGLTPRVIGKVAERLQQARQALDFYTDRFVAALVDRAPEGYITLQQRAFEALPIEIRRRVINRLLQEMGGQKRPVALEALEKWIADSPKKATLNGCVIIRKGGLIFLAREAGRMAPDKVIPPNRLTTWDRYRILSSCPIEISHGGAPTDKKLPYPVRQALPYVRCAGSIRVSFIKKDEKELEKKFALDYKRNKGDIVYIQFV